jgi:hypothetical protein
MQYLQPMLTRGITMVKLRLKVGHAKGKPWTSMVNKMAEAIIEHRKGRVTTKEMSRRLLEASSNPLGSLVVAISNPRITSGGSPVEGWEYKILCSNPKGPSPEATEEAAKEASKRLQVGLPEAKPEDNHRVPGDETEATPKVPGDGMSELEWWAEAVKYIELEPSGLV